MSSINECVVGCRKIDGNFIVAKNRDRTYKPQTKIVHHSDNNVELVFLFDKVTKYAEGMNVKTGVCILNTAVENGLDFGNNVSREGANLLDALISSKDVASAAKKLIRPGKEVHGNSLVTDGNVTYMVEAADKKSPAIKNVSNKVTPTVRTNHTVYIDGAGYTLEGDDMDYISSRTRRAVAEVMFANSATIEDLLDSLNYKLFGSHTAYDTHRNTPGYKTCSQIAMDPISKKFFYRPIPGRESFGGVVKTGPHTNDSGVEIIVLDYNEPTEIPFLSYSAGMHEPLEESNLHKILDPDDPNNDTSQLAGIESAKLSSENPEKTLDYFIDRENEIISNFVSIQDLIRNKDTAMMHLLKDRDPEEEYNRICSLLDDFESKTIALYGLKAKYDKEKDGAKNEAKKRKPRKKGQKKKSSKHSDLFTDEDPKGTIHGLGFKDAATARAGVTKVNKAKRKHAHKVQATLVMKQRGKVAIERTKDPEKKKNLKAANKIWSDHLEKLKKKTKKMNESAVKILLREYVRALLNEGSRIVPTSMSMSEWEAYKKKHKTTAKAYNKKSGTKWKITHGPGHKNAGKTIKGNTGLTYKKAKSIQNAFGGW